MNNPEVTNNEILSAVNTFANHVEERFDKIDQRFDRLEGRVGKIEASMVTKDYLDEKLADLRGDLVVMMRKEDTKLRSLVEILQEKKVLNEGDVKRLFTMEPFAQLSV